ncbi:MAG: hypothetical protein DRP65_12200 [Planctomycetota bacterium]|nr:MAG: hypothetical protein DRP65_12200 [Planctomycetota bacterium]
MNNAIGTTGDMSSAIAISTGRKGRGPFKAVKVRRRASGYELIWKRSFGEEDATGIESFLRESVNSAQSEQAIQANEVVIIVAESRGVAFYRIEIPPVRDGQVGSVVKMQAEALLPLPAGEMQVCWRADKAAGGKRGVTMAAGKTEGLRAYAGAARRFGASKILLDYEGMVKAWLELFGGTYEKTVLIDIAESGTGVVLAENGRLSCAVTLDVGQENLSRQSDWRNTAELFVHDLRNALELFGLSAEEDAKIVVLPEDVGTHKRLISHLKESGISASAAAPRPGAMKSSEEISPKDVIEYIGPIGAAMLALDPESDELNLFEDLYSATGTGRASRAAGSLKRPCVITAAMVVLFVLVSYAVDKASLAQLRKYIYSESGNGGATNAAALIARQQMRKTIAAQRPDMLDLLGKISESGPDGMILDAITFKKRQAVTIGGSCKSYEKLYEFQKKLSEQSGIKEVRIQSSAVDKKKSKVGFKMTFHYKNFTRKK